MKLDISSVSNPFPAEAVATFGKARITCDTLKYMVEMREELSRYLTAYPRDDARFGGAIGLSGGHGSGKHQVFCARVVMVPVCDGGHRVQSTGDPLPVQG